MYIRTNSQKKILRELFFEASENVFKEVPEIYYSQDNGFVSINSCCYTLPSDIAPYGLSFEFSPKLDSLNLKISTGRCSNIRNSKKLEGISNSSLNGITRKIMTEHNKNYLSVTYSIPYHLVPEDSDDVENNSFEDFQKKLETEIRKLYKELSNAQLN